MKEKGALLLVSWLFILLLSPFVSPEAPGEQTPGKKNMVFPGIVSSQAAPWHL